MMIDFNDFNFDKFFLSRDCKYGTQVTYIDESNTIFLNYFTDSDNFIDIIKELLFYIKCDINDKIAMKNNKYGDLL